LTASATSAAELAHDLRLPLGDVHRALRGLEAKGLVGRLPGAGPRFRAAPPDEVFGPLVRRRRAELRAMRADLDALADAYHRTPPSHGVDLLPGPVSGHAPRLLASSSVEVCVLVTEIGPADGTGYAHTPATVPVRVVYPRSLLDDPAGAAVVEAATHSGVRVRLAERPPLPLLVVDRSVALVPVHTPGSGDAVLLVHPGGLQDVLMAVFDRTWAMAEPVPSGGFVDHPVVVPHPDDLRLLELMLDGLTDEAIAGKLDMGTRTVQRRVRELIESAGVRTRVQLIWHATRSGWI
jgi:sugar-specific transcriptional regulator TrmB/DNA-binding CsgD family transcriptional regulator